MTYIYVMARMLSIKSKAAKDISEYILSTKFVSDSSLVTRWGSLQYPELKTLNSYKAVCLASNKKEARAVLAENGIPVPQKTETDYPVVGRPTKHTRGKRFFYCEDAKQVERAKRKGATYFSKYYNKQREYRVHIGSGKVLLFSVKNGDKNEKIWNTKHGFTFRHMARSEWMWANELMEIQRMCKKAVKVLGLDFGAVDVLYSDQEPQRFVITEVNTAPGLSPLGVRKYAEYFMKKIMEDETDSLYSRSIVKADGSDRTRSPFYPTFQY